MPSFGSPVLVAAAAKAGVGSAIYIVLGLVTLVVVVFAVVDAARQPALTRGQRTGWIVGMVVGTLLFGIIGLGVALVYLIGFRPRLQRPRDDG